MTAPFWMIVLKSTIFIDFIDEKRPYQPSQASYYGKYLKMIFSHIFIYGSLYFHMGNNTHSERKAASIHTPALDIPGFCRNSCCHIAGAPGWFSHCNSVFSIHQCRMSRTPPLPCPMIRKIISGSFGESGLKPPQGPEGPQKGKTRTSRLPQNRKSAGQSP